MNPGIFSFRLQGGAAALLVLVAVVSALPIPAAGQQPSSRAEQQVLYRAQSSLEEGRAGECIDILSSYVGKQSRRPSGQVYLLWGNACYEQQAWDAAEKVYLQGLEGYPDHPLLNLNLGLTLSRQKDHLRAAPYFVKAFEHQDKKNPVLLYRAGLAWYLAKNDPRAEEVLERALSLNAEAKAEWMEVLLAVYLRQNKLQAAQKTAGWLIARNPGAARCWKLLAQIRLEQGQHQEAAGILELAYALNEPEPEAWAELAELYLSVNAPLKAAQALERGYASSPPFRMCLRLAGWYARGLRYAKALAWLDRALAKRNSAAVWEKKAEVFFQSGDYVRTVDAARKSLDLDPAQGRVALLLGLAAWHLQRWDLAAEAFQQARADPRYSQQALSCLQTVQKVLQRRPELRTRVSRLDRPLH